MEKLWVGVGEEVIRGWGLRWRWCQREAEGMGRSGRGGGGGGGDRGRKIFYKALPAAQRR